MKIFIGMSLLTSVDAEVHGNHLALAYRLGKLESAKGWQIILYTPYRLSIDRMRNEAARLALLNECDYLMFVDDDMLVQPNVLESLIDADKDIVMAHTYIRGYPYQPMSFKKINEDPVDIKLDYFTDYKDFIDDKGIAECTAVGFATVLIKTHLLKELEPPYFITGPNSTEDVYFCLRCKIEIGPEVSIAIDTRVPTGHKLPNDYVSIENVEALRKYHEILYPKVEVTDERKDRTQKYHEMVEELANF